MCAKHEPAVEGAISRWLEPQRWHRDSDAPCLSLGGIGAFDDMHIFAPCVAFENGRYFIWYCGSKGEVADRVFCLGVATSTDGVHFTKYPASPVYAFDDDRCSILTPMLLRSADGSILREGKRLRLSEVDAVPDWARVDAMTDEDIEAQAFWDPGDPPTDDAFWKEAAVVMLKHFVVVDPDLLE